MSLQIINETMEQLAIKPFLSKEEQAFVVEFAFKTKDKELTNKLISELSKQDKDTGRIIQKYNTMLESKPHWVDQIENLLIALEMYRLEEEKAIHRLADILNAYGIDVTTDEIRVADTKELQERVRREVTL